MTKQQIHYNKPQIRSMIVNAPEEWAVWARGTGKTKGLIAPKSAQYLNMMPRCVGVFVGATFQQLLTRTLPPVIAGWEKLGYINGIHYTIGVKPSQKFRDQWRWQGPYHLPLNFEYFISWWNGAGIQLISQDRAGSSNGVSIDFIMGDEAKLLNEQRLKEELFPANRGIHRELVGNPHHHGKTFSTDMPVGTAGRWILNKQNEMDPTRLQAIITMQMKIYELQQLLEVTKRKADILKLQQNINNCMRIADVFRKNFVYYNEASVLDNIHALGIDYIKEEARSLSKFEFRTALMNQRPYKIEDGFYPSLDEEKHGYFSYDYHRIDKVGYNFDLLNKLDDCRKDGDIVSGKPLHIAMDYNRRIWPVVTGQPVKHGNNINELRVLSGTHVLYPKTLEDALDKWHNYYKAHDNKTLFFWFDHTALTETRQTIKVDIVTGLRKRGWHVVEMYFGKTVDQERRYTLNDDLLRENGKVNWYCRINRDNCKYLLLSMFQTLAEEKNKGFGKSKKTERDPKFPADEAPHYGDAWDTLVYGIVYSGLNYQERNTEYVGMEIRG